MSTTHFVKVYGTILDSSIWYEKDSTRILWITMLAMADSTGYIEAAVPGLAGRARITLEDCEAALEIFQAPDKHSKNQEREGRRVEKVDRGWQLLNYQDYRDMRTESQVKRAERQARWREKKKRREESLVDAVDAPVDVRRATVDDVDGQRGEGRGEKGEGRTTSKKTSRRRTAKPASRKGKTSGASAPGAKNTTKKTTWLTPYLDVWEQVYGGELPPKRAAAGLGPLHTKHGDSEVLPRWRYYLEQHQDKPGIATPQGFSQTYGKWEPKSTSEPMSLFSIDPDSVER